MDPGGGRYVTVSEVKRLEIYIGYTARNGHSPTDTGAHLPIWV
jgi:hypothetical protein